VACSTLGVEATAARDARAEALEWARKLRGPECDVLILEPAPPAVAEPPWFADREPGGERIVRPFGPAQMRWETLAAEEPALRDWSQARWLGPWRRLDQLPQSYAATRDALHALAEQVISPARERANSKIGLRFTLGGFGTPFFGADAQVRVDGATLVVQESGQARRAPLSSLGAAHEFLGALAAPLENDRELDIDGRSAQALGDLCGFASSVLEELRADARGLEPSRVQLWPEHFDTAVELGSETAGQRASYGVSPGDENHPLPYLYVAPWGATPGGELWQAQGFAGAELSYEQLLGASDQRRLALEFYRSRLADLAR